jgi:uncharacterized protein (DUF433 family)
MVRAHKWLTTRPDGSQPEPSQQQILANYPQLELEDFLAVYSYAAELAAGRKASRG